MTSYRTIKANGSEIFYREGGPTVCGDVAAAARLPELVGSIRPADAAPRRQLPRDRAGLSGVRSKPGTFRHHDL